MAEKIPGQRELPVRQDAEPFRSRRITSASFSEGFQAEARLGPEPDTVLIEGQVLDISVHGVGIIFPRVLDQSRDQGSFLKVGETVHELSLYYFGREIYRGSAKIEHRNATDQGLRLGLSLHSTGADLHTLHRTCARLAFRHRWRWLNSRLGRASVEPELATPPLNEAGLRPSFVVWVRQVRHYLKEVHAFLDETERQARAEDLITRRETLEDAFAEACPEIVDRMHVFTEELNQQVSLIGENERADHIRFVRDQLHEYFLLCPFLHRAYHKPLGYAGDYELMNMLYRPESEGDTLFAKVLNTRYKREPAARATINRIGYINRLVIDCIERSEAERVRVANIGCGGARDVVELLTKRPELGCRLEMTLVDQDAQAMQLCERSLTPLARKTGARFQFVADPIQQLLQAEHLGQSLGHRELIYSAGLFDYLDETTFIQSLRVLYSAIVPGGLVAVGNMGAHNPSRHFMEFVVDWYLIHRSRADLERIGLAVTGDPSKVSIDAEPLGLNLFLHIRR